MAQWWALCWSSYGSIWDFMLALIWRNAGLSLSTGTVHCGNFVLGLLKPQVSLPAGVICKGSDNKVITSVSCVRTG
jgi:hypothetical protein